jgi:DNA-binding IclR family transcriptional regulator
LRTESKPIVAAVSISTPTIRMTPDLEKSIKAALLESAARLASRLDQG